MKNAHMRIAMSAMYAVGALLAGAAEVKGRWGTDPAKRAFYRAFRDFNPLNDIGIG